MKKSRTKRTLAVTVAISALTLTSQATLLTFDTGQGDNGDLNLSFASNLASDISGANISNGATPNIDLTWAPSPNVWEVHGAPSFTSIGDGQIVQLDLNGGEANPTITFGVDAGWAFQMNSLVIGHASDQVESDYAWTLTITADGGPEVFTHTTALLGPSDSETVDFNFTGTIGTNYVLRFDDGGANTVRAGIDNLSFNQIAVPEPSILTLLGAGLGVLMAARRLRR